MFVSANEEAIALDKLAAENEDKSKKFIGRYDHVNSSFGSALSLVSEQIEEESKRLEEWKQSMLADKEALDPLIESKTDELNQLRHDISQIKGNGQEEDPSFDVDCKNVSGDTFLIFAAQNNDVQTVRVCLKIGATPTIMNEDGLMATHYSHRFNFEEVTDLLLQVGVGVGFRQVLFLCLTISTLIFSHRMAGACRKILGASSRKWSP